MLQRRIGNRATARYLAAAAARAGEESGATAIARAVIGARRPLVAPRRTQGPPATAQRKDEGKTGGKVSLEDFAKSEGVTETDAKQAGKNVEAANQMSLEQMKSYLGGTAKPVGPRSTKEMLGSIQSGVLPRWVARVGPKATFDGGSFGYAQANQIFATEPSDLVGLTAAQALVKVGWTPEQLKGQVGKEIGLCVLDTQKTAAPGPTGEGPKPGVQEMNWKTLAAVAKDKTKNQYFYSQLKKFKGPNGESVTETDLPALFELASKTPVGAKPDTNDRKLDGQYAAFREALASGLSASVLYSGMGATISEKGQLGAREVMVTNEGTGFKLTSENSVVSSLGLLKQTEVDALTKT